MKFERRWAMPSKQTFSIKPISELLDKYVVKETWVDPMCGWSILCNQKNDIVDGLDAVEYLQTFGDASVDGILFDPPYSPRQVSECYKKLGKTVNMETTQSSYWRKIKDEIDRVVKENGIVISFGWNSNGMGKTRGYMIEEILLVSHGGNHNDTIVTVERKNTPN